MGGEYRVVWGSEYGQERLEAGSGAPDGQGGSRWCGVAS